MNKKTRNAHCNSFVLLLIFLILLVAVIAICHWNSGNNVWSLRNRSGILKIGLSHYEQVYGELPTTFADCRCWLPSIGTNFGLTEPLSKSTNCVKEFDGGGGWVYNPEQRLLGSNAKGWKEELGRYHQQIPIPNGEFGRAWYVKKLIHHDLTNGSFALVHLYDDLGRVTRMDYWDKNSNSLCRISYTYNEEDRITQREIKFKNTVSVTHYDYDESGRLIQEKIGEEIRNYSYNSLGDRTVLQMIQGNDTHAIQYAYQGNHLSAYGDERFYQCESLEEHPWFDYTIGLKILKGDSLSCGEWSIQWNFGKSWPENSYGFNEIKQMGTEEAKTKYVSDLKENFYKRFEDEHWRRFVVRRDRRVYSEIDEAGKELRTYQYDCDTGDILSFSDVADGTQNTKSYFCIRDIQGSVLAWVDAGGKIVERYEYDSWGNILSIYDENGDRISRSRIGNFHLWQGAEYLWDIELYHFGGYLYDPKTGRWLSSLYLEYAQDYPWINLTGYCLNDPVNKVWRCLPGNSIHLKKQTDKSSGPVLI